MLFLESVCQAVRYQVSSGYPILTKLGMVDAVEGGLVLEDSLAVVAELEDMVFDGLEISGGFSSKKESLNTRVGISSEEDEGGFRPIAKKARSLTRLPFILVAGLRSRSVVEDVLSAGDADFVSVCRPLICEPNLPSRFRSGGQDKASCVSGNRCWPEGPEHEGISCKCL